VQQLEMADDLGGSNPAVSAAGDTAPLYGGYAIPLTYRNAGAIWPAAGSQVNLFVYADAPQQVDLFIQPPGGAPAIPTAAGPATPTVPLTASFTVSTEGRHLITACLSTAGAPPARLYIKVDYLGPATPTAF